MKIEAYLLYTERLLSRGAVCPILGSVPAAVKIVLGVLQTGLATLFMILSTPFALCNEKAKEFFNRSFSHLVHGLGNISSGLIEIIPCFCGVCLSSSRDLSHVDDYQYDKFIAYKTLTPPPPDPTREVIVGRTSEVYDSARNAIIKPRMIII